MVDKVVDEIADDEKEEMLVPALEADVLGMVTAKGEELLRGSAWWLMVGDACSRMVFWIDTATWFKRANRELTGLRTGCNLGKRIVTGSGAFYRHICSTVGSLLSW